MHRTQTELVVRMTTDGIEDGWSIQSDRHSAAAINCADELVFYDNSGLHFPGLGAGLTRLRLAAKDLAARGRPVRVAKRALVQFSSGQPWQFVEKID